ncbi:RagB/SusD family nutrient uptake outer membrane protein [uncultured Chitinophaga sp.]|uniref:RagB/SusD family nutrient uptake outer membrane protein n=1 Tax=uncultured Chitinophaga sp. TaxID=339340 RepID=UPI0025F45BCB|nr:RagB/SusD family nutrient uptake outer membrane protein [uncultured Chitinophaga sp.]
MKNSILKISTLSLATIMLAGGCSKSFLDQEIPGRAPIDGFYKTDADAMQATSAVYDFLSEHYNFGWSSITLVKTFPSDESNAGGSGPGDQPGYQALDDFTFDSQNEAVFGAWRMSYYTIARANLVINNVKPENTLRKRLIAESKAIRAYNYLELVSLWGDVPIVLKTIGLSEFQQTPRKPKAEVYAQIEKDLNEAIPDLPLKSEYSAADKFRMSKGTAQALLGKALLYQEKWAPAAAAFDLVIKSGQYDLEPDFAKVFSLAGEFGLESLFEVNYISNVPYDWGNFPWDNGRALESNIHIQLMGPRGDYYKKAPADSLVAGWGFNVPKAKLYDAYVAAGDVKRRTNTVMSVVELKAAGGDWTSPTSWDFEGFLQRKYGSYGGQTNSSGGAVGELNYGTNWRLLRYADVLLMAAEAYYRAGDEDRARTELKKVRLRANLGEVTAGGNALFEAIVLERQLELAFEGYRYVDLVRWGRAATELGPLGFTANKNEVLPIPNNDDLVSGIGQNDNY